MASEACERCPCQDCRGGEIESREDRVLRLLAALDAAPRELRGLRAWLARQVAAEVQGG